MSEKKKRKGKKKKVDKKLFLIVICVVLVIVALILLFCKFLINQKDFYEMESRITNIENSKKDDKELYHTIGWVKVQNTHLDLPVLSGIDDNINFPVEKEKYVWTMSNDDKFHNVINIMGHNIFNLSSTPKKYSDKFQRFEELMSFVYYDTAKDSKYIQLTIDGKGYLYKIYSVAFINAVDVDMLPKEDYTKEELKDYINLLKENTIYDYDVDVNVNDKFISLITCTRFFGNDQFIDFMVTGRLVRENEKINDFNVSKSKKYDEVEKILKGDGDDEEDDSM